FGIGLETEAALMTLAYEAGVPSPRMRGVLQPEDGVGRGFIMDFVAGETLGGRIVRHPDFAEIRPKLAFQCGQILARIHSIARARCPSLPERGPRAQLEELARMYAAEAWPRPVFQLALRWLDARVPAESVMTLMHGDFRNGNLIIGADGVRAVLDWEVAA